MRAGVVVGLTAALWVGLSACGGGGASSGGLGGSGGTAGAAATGGQAAGGRGGSAPADGGAGMAGTLPACAITSRPADPMDPTPDGGFHDVTSHQCNSIDPAGPWVDSQLFGWGDAGAVSDGGAPQSPRGGPILDGDYDLIRLQLPAGTMRTRRTIRVFDGGRTIERAVFIANPSADGGVGEYWYNTSGTPSGTAVGGASSCGPVDATEAYTADGDLLTLFVYQHTINEPTPIGIDTYRRTCRR